MATGDSGTVRVVRVRLFGHSSMTFAEDGPGDSLVERTARELSRLRPDIQWGLESDLLYIAPGMRRHVERRLERWAADVVLLRVAEMHFLHDYVVYRVRERWPRLYPYARRVADVLNRLAGGRPAGAPSPRGAIFRLPRWLAARLIGVAPEVRVQDAIRFTAETLAAVLRSESTQAVLVTSSQAMTPNISAAEAAHRHRAYMDAMRAYSAEHGVLLVDAAAALEALGAAVRLTSDGWHEDALGRETQARLYATAILQALEGQRVFSLPPESLPA